MSAELGIGGDCRLIRQIILNVAIGIVTELQLIPNSALIN